MTTTDPLFGMILALASSPGQQVNPLIQLVPFALVLYEYRSISLVNGYLISKV